MTIHDVAVIGAGPIGLACAHELAGDGCSVVVLEQASTSGGAANGSAGFVVPSLIEPMARPGAVGDLLGSARRGDPVGVRAPRSWRDAGFAVRFAANCRPRSESHRRRVSGAMSELARYSRDRFDDLAPSGGSEHTWHDGGVLSVYADRSAFASAVADADDMAHLVRATPLDSAAARDMEPALSGDVVGAILHPDDASLDPEVFLAALEQSARCRGVRILTDTQVHGWTVWGPRRVEVATGRGSVIARSVVVAAGFESASFQWLAGCSVPVAPARGISLTASTGSGPSMPLLLADRHLALAPMGSRLRLSGGFEVGCRGGRPSPSDVEHMLASARRLCAIEMPASSSISWTGARPLSSDGLPIIGRSPAVAEVVLATGHQMVGLSLSFATGRAVADLVQDRRPAFDLEPFHPRRFSRRLRRRT